MVGNGPYTMESPRSDDEIVLVRNDRWAGDFNGETWPAGPGASCSACSPTSTSYNALEAGEVDNATIPRRSEEARSNWGTTLDTALLASYHYLFNQRDPRIGGPENLLLRQAISMAVDRDAINEAVYNGMRTVSTGITPPGIRGSPRTCATTAPTTPMERRRRTTSGWLPATSRRRSRSSSTPMRVTSRWWRSSSTTWRRSASRPRPTHGSPRPTSPSWPTAPACSAASVGRPTTRRTTTSCTTSTTRVARREQLRLRQRGVRRPDRRGQGDHGSRRPGAAVQPGRGHPPQPGRRVVPINWYLGDYAYNPRSSRLRAEPAGPDPLGADHDERWPWTLVSPLLMM